MRKFFQRFRMRLETRRFRCSSNVLISRRTLFNSVVALPNSASTRWRAVCAEILWTLSDCAWRRADSASRRMLSNSVVTVLNSASIRWRSDCTLINVAAKVNNLRLRRANHVQ